MLQEYSGVQSAGLEMRDIGLQQNSGAGKLYIERWGMFPLTKFLANQKTHSLTDFDIQALQRNSSASTPFLETHRVIELLRGLKGGEGMRFHPRAINNWAATEDNYGALVDRPHVIFFVSCMLFRLCHTCQVVKMVWSCGWKAFDTGSSDVIVNVKRQRTLGEWRSTAKYVAITLHDRSENSPSGTSKNRQLGEKLGIKLGISLASFMNTKLKCMAYYY